MNWLLFAVVAALLAASCGDDDDDSAADAADTPLAAIEQFVELEGEDFAGECPESGGVQPDQCAFELGESGDQIGFAVGGGRDDLYGVYFVAEKGDGFIVDHVENAPCLNATPCPPRAGQTVLVFARECGNIREGPGIDSEIVECSPAGTRAIVTGETVAQDARIWVELDGLGWIATTFIACPQKCR